MPQIGKLIMDKINRRSFFNKISIGGIGAVLLSYSPLKAFSKRKNNLPAKISVKLNPNSVSRNK
jgi:hypothetical protein